ncbi:glycoside hydrolase family 3 protein [Photobacterium sp. SDRW27]|uniref:glycoside hydrolase family 3 protein n=1 Tax=Photobacterium obscurum TaxID=2829490 RepID=UPI00224397A9|nr:glycoside hydrolase family 3 protein [Photobacterium obscurum]MCW8329163.1 glycoside hydrolase family 3 protein [Photobacterium obscurum]
MCKKLPYYEDWPAVKSSVPFDSQQEYEIDQILQQMTLEEKVGQMIQPDLRAITVDDLKQYKLGSMLNGGGAWPQENRYATSEEWAAVADSFWQASEETFSERPFRIPFMWATDAVHGHNNVFMATVFPHNIGLGAANDPDLVRKIGHITATEIASTGLDWTFAPTVTIPRHYNWGRVYEGYSEDPEVVWQYAGKMIEGLQGTASDLRGDQKVLATVKHWIGDGGTEEGVDRGANKYSELDLINIHGPGYFSALEAGAQTVMASFNSWENRANYDHGEGKCAGSGEYNYKIHGSRYLLTDVLKDKMGFDGLVVTDWSGHAEVTGCTNKNANYAVNAGIDILMVPEREEWQAVYYNLIGGVQSDEVSQARVDDAVRRILRVKKRAGLWEKPSPLARSLAGEQSILGAPKHREVAREAVRKSLVLLKNNAGLLPLSRQQKILLAGSAADDIQKQAGGWSLTWQGTETTKTDFPGSTTFKDALEQVVGVENVSLFSEESHEKETDIDTAIVVIGESPYAEMCGDLKYWESLEFASLSRGYKQDHDTVIRLKQLGYKVITVFFSGRPLYVNNEINHSDAFVAAWLPGSEAVGITDVLFTDEFGAINFDFSGRLTFSWPNKKYSKAINRSRAGQTHPYCELSITGEHKPLFSYGYGLSYSDQSESVNSDLNNDCVPLDISESLFKKDDSVSSLFGVDADTECRLLAYCPVSGEEVEVSSNSRTTVNGATISPVNYKHQQDARRFQVEPGHSLTVTIELGSDDVFSLSDNDYLELDMCVRQYHQQASLAFAVDTFHQSALEKWHFSPAGQWKTVKLYGKDVLKERNCGNNIRRPFVIHCTGECELDIGRIAWVRA